MSCTQTENCPDRYSSQFKNVAFEASGLVTSLPACTGGCGGGGSSAAAVRGHGLVRRVQGGLRTRLEGAPSLFYILPYVSTN